MSASMLDWLTIVTASLQGETCDLKIELPGCQELLSLQAGPIQEEFHLPHPTRDRYIIQRFIFQDQLCTGYCEVNDCPVHNKPISSPVPTVLLYSTVGTGELRNWHYPKGRVVKFEMGILKPMRRASPQQQSAKAVKGGGFDVVSVCLSLIWKCPAWKIQRRDRRAAPHPQHNCTCS